MGPGVCYMKFQSTPVPFLPATRDTSADNEGGAFKDNISYLPPIPGAPPLPLHLKTDLLHFREREDWPLTRLHLSLSSGDKHGQSQNMCVQKVITRKEQMSEFNKNFKKLNSKEEKGIQVILRMRALTFYSGAEISIKILYYKI